jgi:chaperone modulatory protein CbpM
MADKAILELLSGEILEEKKDLTLAELCCACQLPAERIIEFVEQGIVDPSGHDPSQWRFRGVSVARVRCAQRLKNDLGVNLAGAALAIELLQELHDLRMRLHRLES